MNPEISVVISTYNRREILGKSLYALNRQSIEPYRYEIVLVDDGSTDGTEQSVNEIRGLLKCSFRYVRQNNKGPAAARNEGINNAKGEIILFLGDDIIAERDLLAQHIKSHKEYPENNIAILGYATWAKDLEITPFMYWLEHGGSQWRFDEFENGSKIEWKYFYTCNLSLEKAFLLENSLFDEDFRYATYEDSELGYRLMKKGLVIIHNRNAMGYHDHPTTLRSACKKAHYTGISKYLFLNKISEEDKEKPSFNLPEWNGKEKSLSVKTLDLLVRYLIASDSFLFLEKMLNMIVKLSGKSWIYYLPLNFFEEKGSEDERNKRKIKKI